MMLHKNHAAIEHLSGLELKFADAGSAGQFSGHAAAFSLDSHRDIIRAGAFTATIAKHRADGRMPPLLMSHDQTRPIGKITSMAEDGHGLAVAGQFNMATSAGREAHAHAKAGDVSGLSIGYVVPPGGATQQLTEIEQRLVRRGGSSF